MHSIERYGIVALLFLVVTVVAVLMWDGGKDKPKEKAKDRVGAVSAPAEAAPALDQPDEAGRRLRLLAENQPGPLQRQPRARRDGGASLPAATERAPAPSTLTDEGAAESAALSAETEASAGEESPLQPPQTPREQPAPEQVVGALPAGATHAYSVRSGDTLSEIAQRELGSSRRWKDIAAVNPGLDPTKLHVGKTIQIPGAGAAGTTPAPLAKNVAKNPAAASSAKPAAGQSAPAAGAGTWKVGQGESLWKIAAQTLGDGKRWREIAALNPSVNPDKLTTGLVLKLPSRSAGAKASTPKLASAPVKETPKAAPKTKPASTLVASNAGSERSTRRGGKVK